MLTHQMFSQTTKKKDTFCIYSYGIETYQSTNCSQPNWHHLRCMNWELMDLICPRVILSMINRPQCSPDCTVTLESRPKSNLPHPITFLNPPLGFTICKLIPQWAARSVPEPIQGHPWRLHVPFSEPKVPLKLIKHCSPSCMDAEMLEGELEVWYVRLDILL